MEITNVESYKPGVKGNITTEFNKLKPKKLNKSYDNKNVVAYDFEVLTEDNRTKPVMISRGEVRPEDDYIKTLEDPKTEIKKAGRTKEVDTMIKARTKTELLEPDEDKQVKLERVLSFLTSGTNFIDRNSLKVFYNLKYDLTILISLLPERNIRELDSYDCTIIYCEGITYYMTILGNKSFTLEVEGQPKDYKYTFYDIAQFTYTSLDNAVKSWFDDINLKLTKGGMFESNKELFLNNGFNPEVDNETAFVFNNRNVYESIIEDAVAYCERDCYLTACLTKKVKSTFENIEVTTTYKEDDKETVKGIPFLTPYSSASIYKAFVGRHYANKYPTYDGVYNQQSKKKNEGLRFLSNKWQDLQSLSYSGYFGGWFEMFKRGYFPDAYGFDYASMYPSIQRNLININDMSLKKLDLDKLTVKRVNKLIEESTESVLKCKVWIKDDAKILPNAVRGTIKRDGKSINKIMYPITKGNEIVMSKDKYLFLRDKYPYTEKLEVTEVYTMKPKSGMFYDVEDNRNKPFWFLNGLYETRQEYIEKYGKDDKHQQGIKILINAGYGVTAEVNESKNVNIKDLEESVFVEVNKESKAGKLFRPYYAFKITETGRLNILKDIFNNDIEDEVIGVATDCIYCTKDGADKLFKSDSYSESKVFGKLELDYQGEMIVVGNGVYQIHDTVNDYYTISARGFNERNFPNLFTTKGEDLRTDKLKVTSVMPFSWKECLKQGLVDTDRMGLFTEQTKACSLNMDVGRIWDNDLKTFEDLKTKSEGSRPLKVYPTPTE